MIKIYTTTAAVTNISSVSGAQIGDIIVSGNATSRNILGNTVAMFGGCVRITGATTGVVLPLSGTHASTRIVKSIPEIYPQKLYIRTVNTSWTTATLMNTNFPDNQVGDYIYNAYNGNANTSNVTMAAGSIIQITDKTAPAAATVASLTETGQWGVTSDILSGITYDGTQCNGLVCDNEKIWGRLFTLTRTQGAGTTMTVTRTSSPYGKLATGTIGAGSGTTTPAVAFGDTLTASVVRNVGYENPTISWTSQTISGNAAITSSATAVPSYTLSRGYPVGGNIRVQWNSSPRAGASGSHLGIGNIMVYNQDSITITAVADNGYTDPQLTVTGSGAVRVDDYTYNVTNVSAAITATADFTSTAPWRGELVFGSPNVPEAGWLSEDAFDPWGEEYELWSLYCGGQLLVKIHALGLSEHLSDSNLEGLIYTQGLEGNLIAVGRIEEGKVMQWHSGTHFYATNSYPVEASLPVNQGSPPFLNIAYDIENRPHVEMNANLEFLVHQNAPVAIGIILGGHGSLIPVLIGLDHVDSDYENNGNDYSYKRFVLEEIRYV